MNQRERLKQFIIEFCNDKGNRTFSSQDLKKNLVDYSIIGIGGKTPHATVRRLLQELRDEKFISFLDNSGHYTLRGIDLLQNEKEDLGNLNISNETPEKREYLVETYARSSGWVKKAKEMFGLYCMVDGCKNTFLTKKNQPYIEVHHIIPLHIGGEDGIWNLSVLCAHHHKMAHFSHTKVANSMQKQLLSKTEQLRTIT